jgi:hypothetical protein
MTLALGTRRVRLLGDSIYKVAGGWRLFPQYSAAAYAHGKQARTKGRLLDQPPATSSPRAA